MNDWRLWVVVGVFVLWQSAWTLFCLEFAYRLGRRVGALGAGKEEPR